jgi:hypothetical protein
MSPGIAEEAGQTARSTVGALASTPAVLAIILLAGIFATFITFSINREREQAHAHSMAVLERCFPIALMEAYRDLEIGDAAKFDDRHDRLPGSGL